MDKKYWFKLDKDKIKLQLKALGKKFTRRKSNVRLFVLVLLFFVLVGAGYAVYRNDTTNINPAENGIPLVKGEDRTAQDDKPTININPYDTDTGYSLDYSGIESQEEKEAESSRFQKTTKKGDQLVDTKEKTTPEEDITGVVTESLRPLEVNREQSFSLLKPISGEILQEPGWYYHPVLDDWRYQHGIELGGNSGDIVMAAEAGRVVSVKQDEYRGIMVTIEHENGWKTQYGHLQRTTVASGQVVARGQEIGRVGSTGMSSTPSLYFVLSNQDGPIDPREYFTR